MELSLRDYQQTACDNIVQGFQEHKRLLLVMATGLGKTVVFSHVLQRLAPRGRCMVMVHLTPILEQNARTIRRVTGYEVAVERAEHRSDETGWYKAPVVVTTRQTQIAGRNGFRRYQRYFPDDFALLIADEAHHSTCASDQEIYKHYQSNDKLLTLGATATPNRTDEAAVMRNFDAVPFEMGLRAGIDEGWLVDIAIQPIVVDGLDYSKVKTKAGELNSADLEAVLTYEKPLIKMAHPTFELAGDRKTLVFCAGVEHAARFAELLNRYGREAGRSDCARFISYKMPPEVCTDTIEDFRRGAFQFLVSVGKTVEGFDVPDIGCISMCRPTLSVPFMCQMLGRGTRTLDGLVDRCDDAAARREAIRTSGKSELLVLDFHGNTGRHKLASPVDVLGADYRDDEIEIAKRMFWREGQEENVGIMLEKARAERLKQHAEQLAREEARAKQRDGVIVHAQYRVLNPHDALGLRRPRNASWVRREPPTVKMCDALRGFKVRAPEQMSRGDAGVLLGEIIKRFKARKCSWKQAAVLKGRGFDTDCSPAEASRIIDGISEREGWRKR